MTPLFSLSGDQDDTATSSSPLEEEARVDLVTAAPTPPSTPAEAPAPAPAPAPTPAPAPRPAAPPAESGFAYRLNVPATVVKVLSKLKRTDARRHTRVQAALRLLEEVGPDAPKLGTKKLRDSSDYPKRCFQSVIEQGTPAAWRMWWTWGQTNQIDIYAIGPHP